MILFGDFKQLPPVSSRPPFIALPRVYDNFDFRVLRQNRRVVKDEQRRSEIENFHGVLFDVSRAICSERVTNFLVQAYPSVSMQLFCWPRCIDEYLGLGRTRAHEHIMSRYVRGLKNGTAKQTALEGTTAVFSKRRV